MKNFFIALVTLFFMNSYAVAGNTVKFLAHGDESLSARLLEIERASSSIDYATYIFEPCDSSAKMILEALSKKAQNGIKVRMIIDAYELKAASKQKLADLYAYIKSQKIEVRYYNAFGVGFERSHIKMMVIDGKLTSGSYISGGRNSSDAYFGLSSKTNYLDHDLLVSGDSVKSAQTAFDELWLSPHIDKYDKGIISSIFSKNPDLKTFAENCLKKSARDIEVADYFGKNKESLVEALPQRQCSNVSFFIDNDKFRSKNSSNENKPDLEQDLTPEQLDYKRTTKNYLNFISGTQSNLFIHNQFYLPLFRLDEAFKKLRNNNKKVLIFTNLRGDAGSLTQAMTQLMHEKIKSDSKGTQVVLPISSLGAIEDAVELTPQSAQGQWRIHTKTAIRDHQDIFLGSFNIDKLSYKENLEEGMVLTGCNDLASDIESEMLKLADVHNHDKEKCKACDDEFSKDTIEKWKGILLNYF